MPIRFLKEIKDELPNFMWVNLTYSGDRSKTKLNKKGKRSMSRGFYTDKDMEAVWAVVEKALEQL
jgi:hypothetical protein